MLCSLALSPNSAEAGRIALAARGEYFDIYADRSIDIYDLLIKLDHDYSLRLQDPERPAARDLKEALFDTFDELFREVEGILNITIPAFHGQVHILKDQSAVSKEFKRLNHTECAEAGFYYPRKNIVFISFDGLALGAMGYQVAQAILERYFVVTPPGNVREVLAGYVEYNLRKAAGELP